MFRRLSVSLGLGLSLLVLASQVSASERLTPKEMMEGFCDSVMANDARAAASYVIGAMEFGQGNENIVEKQRYAFIEAIEDSKENFGNLVYCELGNRATIGENIVRLAYIGATTAQVTAYIGHFVKHEHGWQLFDFDYTSDEDKFPYSDAND